MEKEKKELRKNHLTNTIPKKRNTGGREDNMAIVYQHRRKDNNSIFYIGIGEQRNRAYSKKNRTKYWYNIVSKYGYEIDILIDGLDYKSACEVEVGMIMSYGRNDLNLGNLVNLTNGGEGSIGYKHTEETMLKITGKNNHRYGKGYLQEGKLNHMYGKKGELSPMYGKKGMLNHKSKKVYQFSKEGILIQEYGSIREAERNTKISSASISMCCNNHPNYSHAGGFIWKY